MLRSGPFRSAQIIIALAFLTGPVVGCGDPKPPDAGAEGAIVNPKDAFAEGVRVLNTPTKEGTIDYTGAYSKFAQAIELDANYAKAHYNAGWVSERLGNMPQAESHYRSAMELDGSYKLAIDALADVLTQEGKGTEAVALYQAQVDANPDDVATRTTLMEAMVAAGDDEGAIAQAREILLKDPKNVGAYRSLSRVYFANGEYEMSQLCADKAKTLAEGDSGIYNNMGVTYLMMDDEAAAIEEFKTARKLDPDNLEANLNLGWVAVNSGDYILAQDCFEKTLQGTPGSIDAKLGLAIAYRGVKEYDKAAKLYEEILDADPKNKLGAYNASTLHEKYIKDYKKANKYLEGWINAANEGQIGPSHDVYGRMERIKASQEKEEARKREEERKKKEAEDRKKRQQEQFNALKAKVGELQAMLDKYGECEMMVEMGGTDMGMMVLEQAQMVVEAEEVDMAGDVMTFVDEVLPQLQEIIPSCSGGAAPAGGSSGGDAPAAPAESGGDGSEPAPEEGGGE